VLPTSSPYHITKKIIKKPTNIRLVNVYVSLIRHTEHDLSLVCNTLVKPNSATNLTRVLRAKQIANGAQFGLVLVQF